MSYEDATQAAEKLRKLGWSVQRIQQNEWEVVKLPRGHKVHHFFNQGIIALAKSMSPVGTSRRPEDEKR